ncbi:MAG TPA: hypothetical protein VNT27_07260 [Propionibacteriaceae bacterium]|nr:hypothetical protein [Propionibacteriaceae bacterium]
MSFAFTFRAAGLLGFAEEVGDGAEEVAAAGVGLGLAGEVGAGCGEEPALHAAADATTSAPTTTSEVRRSRRRANTVPRLPPPAEAAD